MSTTAVRAETIEGFNTFLAEQRTLTGRAILTLAQFDHEYELVVDRRPLPTVRDLTEATYVPPGKTALLDAIGRTIVWVGARLSAMHAAERPGRVIVVVLTDGAENHSREYSASRVRELVEHQTRKYAWEFVFLGANMDAVSEAMKLGIPAANAAAFVSDKAGTAEAFCTVGRRVREFRGR